MTDEGPATYTPNSLKGGTIDTATIDTQLRELAENATRWARLPIAEKLRYLWALRRNIGLHAQEWVDQAVAGKGIEMGSEWSGEEWISGPYAVLTSINALTESLQALATGEDPLRKARVRTRPGGQVVVDVFPLNIYDRLLLSGYTAEVWMQPEVTASDLRDHVATFYSQSEPAGALGVILGAGNISSIPLLDLLTKMFIEGQVVAVKMNPVNDYLGPVFEKIASELIEEGFAHFVYGGPDVGRHLTGHELVDAVHVTGTAKTHDEIVFGPGEVGADRKARNEPILQKAITSELGGVSPTIVVPGPWSDRDFAYQAEHLATQKFHNAGFNCIASQVLVLPEAWEGSDKLVEELRKTIRSRPNRFAYYPGAAQRQADALAKHPGAEVFDEGPVPRTLITDVDATGDDDYCFTTEFFGNVYATTKLPAPDAPTFLRNAVEFANRRLTGTLGAQLLVHPLTARELGPALEDAIAELEYGSVGVNAWTGAAYLLPTAAWGAFPGHPLDDVGSGQGAVHNALMLDKPEKTVVRAPFFPFPRTLVKGQVHLSPKPPWFITHRRADKAGERLTKFAADPSARHLPGIFAAALRN